MQFTSIMYLGFFCAVFLLHYVCPCRFRWAVLLAGSLVFYSLFSYAMLAILLACTAVSYLFGRCLSKRRNSKGFLVFAVALSLTPLLFFKYADSIISALGLFGSENEAFFSALTPLGLSFFTFKILAYLFDVHSGKIEVCTHFGKYALYVTFFTQIASGPIQKPSELIAQIENPTAKFNYDKAISGAQLILFGLFKKLLIADALLKHVAIGFESHFVITGPSVILAVLFYTVQLYCDFSGYSDISTGCMYILGYSAPQNFKSPYFATSITNFWARWHITLSSFLREYVYFPMGGSRKGTARTYINIIVTFFISGLWHGTGLNYVVWGLLHGLYQVVGRLFAKLQHTQNGADITAAYTPHKKVTHTKIAAIKTIFKTCLTFVLVSFAWVFFGANSVQQALGMFAQMPVGFSLSPASWLHAAAVLQFGTFELVRIIAFCAVVAFIDYKTLNTSYCEWLARLKKPLRLAVCYFFIFAVVIFAPLGATPFIYFQF